MPPPIIAPNVFLRTLGCARQPLRPFLILSRSASSAFAIAAPSRLLTTARASRHATSSAINYLLPSRPTLFPSPLRKPWAEQRRFYKTVEEAKSRYSIGPFSWKAFLLFLVTGAGLVWYFGREKDRMRRKRIVEAGKGVGRPRVGGPFELMDHYGGIMTAEDLKGQYSLVYFGFTHCPDICPDELDKMGEMIDIVEAERPGLLLPVFVTCDPARDGPEALKAYLAEFHPRLVGLTGTYEQIKGMCKTYRVYFSTPKEIKPGEDYLVDHSIYFYLMGPDGEFIEALGRQHSPTQGAKLILGHMKDYKGKPKAAYEERTGTRVEKQ